MVLFAHYGMPKTLFYKICVPHTQKRLRTTALYTHTLSHKNWIKKEFSPLSHFEHQGKASEYDCLWYNGVLKIFDGIIKNDIMFRGQFHQHFFVRNFFHEAFLYLHFRFELLLEGEYWRKCAYKMLVKLDIREVRHLSCLSWAYRKFFWGVQKAKLV